MKTKRETTAGDILRRIKSEDIKFLDLKFVDLFGALQHLTFPTSNVDESTFSKGVGFDGSSVKGYQSIDKSDMIMKPDPSSAFMDPFFDDPCISVLCDIIDPIGHKSYARDPRGVARRTEELMLAKGISDAVFLGPELEFFVFDDVRYDQTTQHGFYYIKNDEAFWNTGSESSHKGGHRPRKQGAYFAAPPADAFLNLRNKMSTVLQSVGMDVELHHHEVAAAGQNEIGVRFETLKLSADNAIKFKYVIKNVAAKYNKTATFMPKPLFEENGSGMHINVSMFKDGRNIFFDRGRYADLSETAEMFIAGIIKHAASLCAFCAPTTNSYRRLVPGYEAPINLAYSGRNRSACVRIPLAGGSPKATRVEFRTPDPSANPYLAFSAVILAGLDGIEQRLQAPDPIDEDIYKLVESDQGQHIESVPGSLEKAIDALEQDHEYLTRDGVFDESLIQKWISMKRTDEINHINLRPHPSEFALYIDA